MMYDTERAVAQLKTNDAKCVLVNGEIVLESQLKGIAPMMLWIEEAPDHFRGACIADKVIGKAAAMLAVYGGAQEVYALMISEPASEYLKSRGISFAYEKIVPQILNRAQDGFCPMESLCLTIDAPEEAYEALKEKIANMKAGK